MIPCKLILKKQNKNLNNIYYNTIITYNSLINKQKFLRYNNKQYNKAFKYVLIQYSQFHSSNPTFKKKDFYEVLGM